MIRQGAWRYLGVRMRRYEDVVEGPWREIVTAYAEGVVDAHTTIETHTAKGRLRKRPILHVDPAVRLIKSALGNPALLANRLDFPGPSLRFVPREEAEAYAVEDAVMTLRLREVL